MYLCTKPHLGVPACLRGAHAAKRETLGQATVEAALLIPVLLVTLMLLIQPGILLYNHMVMSAAASEGCRLLATAGSAAGADSAAYENYIKRRLGSIPEQDLFHVHGGGCSYQVELQGSETTAQVKVGITNKVRLLPLFDGLAQAFGAADEAGCITQKVEVSLTTKDGWVAQSPLGLNPQGWVQRWQ